MKTFLSGNKTGSVERRMRELVEVYGKTLLLSHQFQVLLY